MILTIILKPHTQILSKSKLLNCTFKKIIFNKYNSNLCKIMDLWTMFCKIIRKISQYWNQTSQSTLSYNEKNYCRKYVSLNHRNQ